MASTGLLERRVRVMGRHSPLFYEQPLELVRGEGVWVYDERGRRYLDAYNNVPHVGHAHPRVATAVARQMGLLNTHSRYLHEGVVGYAERLAATFAAELDTVTFTCSGSEANELALRVMRAATGGVGVIASAHAYHGNTTGVLPYSTIFTTPDPASPLVRTIPVPDPYRDGVGRSGAELAKAYADDVRRAIASFRAGGVPLAGLLLCTTFSGEGLPTMPQGYMAQVLREVHAAGGLFIADEVQSGFGRSGTHMWGHQRLGVTADLVTLGKPIGNGYPMAAVIGRRELFERFGERSLYFNTTAATPVAAAAGAAVLDVMAEEGLMANAARMGELLRQGLGRLAERHELIGDVRGAGLFVAVELVEDRTTKLPATAAAGRIVEAAKADGVLINRIGVARNILKIRPPMVFALDHVELLLATLDRGLARA